MIIVLLGFLTLVSAGSKSDTKDSYKNQYCTDPRTMKKHPAYTEWADAYSCTRHRCQPGGRNLAIYTVGCKRVEAPESAIECEEVVEDTNMQFPFCCTRLRCLVVVRGEVWTRVLGQPWEVLPAAPWSHMYKMKKPPPSESTYLPMTVDHQGPVYELTDKSDSESDKEESRKTGDSPVLRTALPSPDIVIALSTNNEGKESSTTEKPAKHSRRGHSPPVEYFEEEVEKEKQAEQGNQEMEEVPASTDKPSDDENEKLSGNNYYPVTQKPHHKSYRRDNIHSASSWTEIPIDHWDTPKEGENIIEAQANFSNEEQQVSQKREPKVEALMIPVKKEAADGTESKPSNLQALVDAIGTRMRDIESVVQKMSDKVHQGKAATEGSSEKRLSGERDGSRKQFKDYKRPSSEDENYKRFQSERGTKYLRSSTETSTEKPLFIGDINVKGYFSDPSNSILRRNNPSKMPKEPPPTYMAPVVEKRHKPVHIAFTEAPEEESEKRNKKHGHKKRRSKGPHAHKKRYRSKEDRRKINKLSIEVEKNAVSLGDSSDTQ